MTQETRPDERLTEIASQLRRIARGGYCIVTVPELADEIDEQVGRWRAEYGPISGWFEGVPRRATALDGDSTG